jgi:flagellar biosynthesis protein FlhF
MADAMAQVKTELGRDAVILATRVVERRAWLGLRRREVYEITAGKNINLVPRRPVMRETPRSRAAAASGHAGAPARRPAPPAGGAGGTGNGATPPTTCATLLQTPAATASAMLSLSSEIDSLKSMVKDLVSHVRHEKSPGVPEELFEHYLKLVECQVADELAKDIVQSLQRSHRPELLASGEFVREKIAEQIEKLIPVAGAINRTKTSGPHIVALVGPTGVGKTTTIAKLAANLKLREKRRVGLITMDTYRIAAIDQLRKYADILGAPLRVGSTPDDIEAAIASMSDADFILIDTAGRSPNDQLKIGELRAIIERAQPDEVHLVLSSNYGQRSMELAVERFGDVRIDRVIFTKVDEAPELGVVLNVIRKLNKSVSYITTGQDVPNDIEVGQGKSLARRILGMTS